MRVAMTCTMHQVLRDFHLKMTNDAGSSRTFATALTLCTTRHTRISRHPGEEISSDEYLEDALQMKSDEGMHSSRNAIREVVVGRDKEEQVMCLRYVWCRALQQSSEMRLDPRIVHQLIT